MRHKVNRATEDAPWVKMRATLANDLSPSRTCMIEGDNQPLPAVLLHPSTFPRMHAHMQGMHVCMHTQMRLSFTINYLLYYFWIQDIVNGEIFSPLCPPQRWDADTLNSICYWSRSRIWDVLGNGALWTYLEGRLSARAHSYFLKCLP